MLLNKLPGVDLMRKTPRAWIQTSESHIRGVARIPLWLKPSRDSRATSHRDSPIWIQPHGVYRSSSGWYMVNIIFTILYFYLQSYIDHRLKRKQHTRSCVFSDASVCRNCFLRILLILSFCKSKWPNIRYWLYSLDTDRSWYLQICNINK